MSESKGLQRYVPRILQDSGMIASSEVAHYTHLNLVQYVKADDADTALRRAKVEVLKRAAMEVCTRCNDPENWAPMSNSGYHLHNKSGRHLLARCYATKIHALKHVLNASTAQIEEWKHGQT